MTTQRGFTLIEMAIVLVIITLLIGGLVMPLSAQIQARRIAETNRTLEDAREAIVGYAMTHTTTTPCVCMYTNTTLDATASTCPATLCPSTSSSPSGLLKLQFTRHYLPCPDKLDDGNPGTTDDGDGVEDRVGGTSCAQSQGYLPWVTLGTGSQDAWGNRLRYAVTDAFSNTAGFSSTDTGDFQICNASANAGNSDCTPGNVASNVPVVLLSHGPNGWGGRNISGANQANPTSNNERENANTNNTDKEFVSRTPSKANDSAGEFDDLVKWISADQLRGQLCSANECL